MRHFTQWTCQYCAGKYSQLERHEAACIRNPAIWQRTAQALDDGAGQIRNSSQYKAATHGGVAYATIMRTFTTWDAVAHAFGLRPCPRPPLQTALDRAVAADVAANPPHRPAPWHQRGLTVTRVTDDGAGRVRYMLK